MTATIPAPTPGIFWHRPDPDAAPFLAPGDEVVAGQIIGVIEVMKMFVEIPSDRTGTVKGYVAADGETVPIGAPLVEFEDAA